MQNKIKAFFTRNWEEILAGIIGTGIMTVLGNIFGTLRNFIVELSSMSAIYNVFLWVVFAVGVSVIIYAFIRLLQRILGKDSDLVIYDGLTLEKDRDDAYVGQYARVGANLSREAKLWIIVHNANKPVYDCVVDLENMEYKGRYSNNEWVNSLSDFDRKAMKWDVGYLPNEGKIDINARTRKKLEIAVAFPQPMATMELSHLDGHSKRGHLLDGVYRVTLRIDGKVSIKQVRNEIKTRWYEVEFDYQHSSAILKLLEIKEYEPPKEAI